MVGINKITFIDRLQLLTMYTAGFKKEAQDYALELGCTKHYASVLHSKMQQKLRPREIRHNNRWQKAIANGKITI